ncbi:hypothetical protein D9757_008868 [Collybiopsis confluens]|uniref:NAD(P)-binding protein n=1 Tax=Collybiopsis confluens TaxID=2823264 RepID=A0A8H5H3J1_9AGAR|nr:hypothetical protein D9757_008868 [Collybiopsis confluens]
MPSFKPLLVVAGVGKGGGTGAATARAFAKEGYSIALIARGADSLKSLEDELRASGVEATAFRSLPTNMSLYDPPFKRSVTDTQPSNTVSAQPSTTPHTGINGGFAFAKEVISEYKNNEIDNTDGLGKRGVLIFTGATASVRGNTTTSAFAAGKFALRALSQSLAKEFGKDNIHVSHAIVDGAIVTPQGREQFNNPPIYDSQDQSLTPEGISAAYVYLAKQPRSAWTWELDLRPAHEKW